MENKIGFFQNDVNSNSITRVIIFMFALFTILASGYCFVVYDWTAGLATFSAMATIVLTGKVASNGQEIIDNKIDKLTYNK